MQTSVQDDAGKYAKFDETFILENIREQVLNDEELVLETYDEDVLQHDFLGAARPIWWADLINTEAEVVHTLDLYDKKTKTGTLKIATQYIYVPLKAVAAVNLPKPNVSAYKALWKGTSVLAALMDPSAMTEGTRMTVNLKN